MDNFTQFKKNRNKLLLAVRCLLIIATIFICSPQNLWAESNDTPSLMQQINEKLVTLNFTNKPLKEILLEIKKQTNIGFVINVYVNQEELKSMSITAKNESVASVLNKLLKNTKCEYKIVENEIVITTRKTTTQKESDKLTINGTVIDADTKKPIAGATIIILGTSNGAISDESGKFSFTAQVGEEVEISFIGMKGITKRISANDVAMVIEMQKDAMAVDDVIVTGIFQKAKESYTGAVTSVTSKDLKMYKGQNVLATLKNIDPSLNVVANNNFGSDPNRLPEVNIRGNSSLPKTVKELNEGAGAQLNAPLVVMDGFEISLQKLMDYNDEEIASINILKDASATAIYGSRGANGVIVIITKIPEAGKLRISVKAGINIEMPDLSSYDLMNASEKLEIERISGLYNSETPSQNIELKNKYNAALNDVLKGVDTYWLGKPIRTGIGQQYNISLTGGNNEFKWSTILGYNNVMGAMKDSKRDNFSGSVMLSYTLKNVIFKNQTSITSNKGNESRYGLFSDYARMNPYWRIYDEKGDMIKSYSPIDRGNYENPLYNSNLNIINDKTTTEIINNFAIEWDILESLKFRAQFGISKSFDTGNEFYPASHTKFNIKQYEGSNRKGSYKYTTGEGMNYDGNATLAYSKTFNAKHQLYVGLDYSMAQRKGFDLSFLTEGFPNEDLTFLSNALQYGEGTKPSGSESVTRRIGFTGNLNYTYNSRYFVDFSYRIDGSSQFGNKNRFAPFWSAGLGWNIHNEKFMKDAKVLNSLRLKGSYGQTGSQQFSAYQALSTLQFYSDKKYMMWNAAQLMGLGNENLKWQTTDQMNVGIEFGLLNNRILGSFDYYNKKTSNLLSQMDIPLAQGFDSYIDNVGEIKNNGFEAMLSGYIIRDLSRDISWSVTGKIAYNNNEITKLSDAIKAQNREELLKQDVEINNLLYEGRSINSIYAVRSMGIDPSTGAEVFIDKNNNVAKEWRASDKVYMGVSEPKYRGNLSTLFSYKGLSVNLSFGYHFGGKQYNNTLIDKVEVTYEELNNNVDKRVLYDRWQKPGDVKFFKGISKEKTKATSRFVMSDNVFELQSASLSYRLSTTSLIEKAKIQSITFGVNMSDVFYISSVKRERGISYPFARRIGLSVSLLF